LIGKTVAHYEITSLLGKGGMGEVFRARDIKLDRDVAFKVLPQELSGDPERAARFEREARMLASLQHANIASIYGYEHIDGIRFLTMELAEGEDLAERLEQGRVQTEEALNIALQIAIGLEAAHDKNIMHRDLKPANVKVDADGVVKILDFGLARAYAGDASEPQDLATSPTITAAMTQAGVILGTAAYMSPEQAKGKSVDHRSDIWSFGVILFEMLCGRKLFEGETVSETMAEVMKNKIEWSTLPEDTPRWARNLLQRCLDRDPSSRLQSIGEARIALQRGQYQGEDGAVATSSNAPVSRRWPWFGVVAALLVLAATVAWNGWGGTAPELLTQSTLMPPPEWDFDAGSPFAVSPDGRQIAFVANASRDNDENTTSATSIWLRDLSTPESRRVEGTDGAAYPFWSPDGRWIAFFAQGKLNKIAAGGGPVIPLCDTRNGRSGTWNKSGTIVFQRNWSEGLMKIPAAGGTPEPITTLSQERFDVAHRWPRFLPDGQHFLFYLVSTTSQTTSEFSGIYVGSLGSDETRLLLKSESRGLYSEGHLLYRAGSTLMARPFDAGKQVFTGDPTPVSTDIPGGSISWGGAQFGASETGPIVHLRGAGATNSLLTWRDREGNPLGIVGEQAGYWEPTVSHDGKHVAVSMGQDAADIWLHDLVRDVRTRFTFDSADDRSPLWSPDDSSIVFSSARNSVGEIYQRPVSGQGGATLLNTPGTNISLTDWSHDGRWVLFSSLAPGDQGWDLWALDMQTSVAEPILDGPFNESSGRLSPDGRWLSFTSDESGDFEVYVQSFPDANGRWMVSTEGGNEAYWRGDGRELFFIQDARVVMAVDVTSDTTFSFGRPRPLFTVSTNSAVGSVYNVSQDGQRFLFTERLPVDPSKVGARLIQNWTAGLR
jgi:Tol biopolymer transport system component